ncbi:MAG: tetratricopeptide repeat protein, partial [Bacteroidia bacterium]
MNKTVFIFLLSAFFFRSAAQEGTITAANKLYDEKAYAEAIPKYEKVIKKDSSNADVLSRLGDCYRLTNNTKGQLACYGKLVKDGKAEDTQKFWYGKALMGAGRYDEAKQVMDQVSGDSRGKNFAKAMANMKAFSKNEDAYKMDTVPFNSSENDFAPIFYKGDKNKIVFTSSRGKTQWISKKHAWTDRNYYNLYLVEKTDGK